MSNCSTCGTETPFHELSLSGECPNCFLRHDTSAKRVPIRKIECQCCHTEFYTCRPNSRFCSSKCKQEFHEMSDEDRIIHQRRHESQVMAHVQYQDFTGMEGELSR